MLAASRDRDDFPPDRCVASVNLVAEPCGDSLESRSAATLDEQRARLPGYVLLDLENASLAGRAAVRSLFTYRLDHFQIVVDQWLIVERGWAWSLSGGSDTIAFPEDAAVLEAIAATLELPVEPPTVDGVGDPRAADAARALEADTDVAPRRLDGSARHLLALVDEAAGVDVSTARAASARDAIAETAGLAAAELTELAVELLGPVRDHSHQLELQIEADLVLGWLAGDEATLLAPDGADLAVLRRVPTAALPVALVGQIPSLPASPARPGEPLELPPGVLANVLATRTLPTATMPGPARDALLALTRGLRAWWRLEIGDRHREAAVRIVEGLHVEDGPWRLVAHEDVVRLDPVRPRDVFRTLCDEVLRASQWSDASRVS